MKSLKAKVLALGALSLCAASAQAVEVSWNGFGSVYYGQALTSNLLVGGLTDKHVNFTNYSLMGLNVGAKVNDDMSFAAQLVALGSPVGSADAFGLIAQWAYFNYTPTEIKGLSFKGGRQLYPILMASEYVRVGYLLPYRQIPFPMTTTAPFTRFDGVSANQTVDTSVGRVTVGVFGGKPILDSNSVALAQAGLSLVYNDLIGGTVTLDGDGWRVRAMASRDTVQETLGTFAGTAHRQHYSAGYRYDKNNIVTWGEYLLERAPDGTPLFGGQLLGTAHSYYLLGGYRIGNFMPRYTFSQASNTKNVTPTYNGNITTHTVGVNYTMGQAVVKAEYEIDLVPAARGGGTYATQPVGSTATSGSAFFLGVDFIF